MECTRAGEPGSELVASMLAVVVVMGSIGGAVTVGVDVARAANDETNVVEGTPDLNASAPDARLNPGQDGTIGITLTNDATIDDNNGTHPQEARRRAGEARSVRVEVSDTRDAPITVETGQRSVGTIGNGESSGPHTFNVHVDENADAGTYTVEVTTRYRHAKRVEYEERTDGDVWYNETVVNRTETETITVVVEPEARFEVTDIDHDVPLGGEGVVSVEVTNTGDENVTESTISLTSSDSDFYFGSGTATSEAEVGQWDAGETKRLRFRAGTVDAAVNRSYPIDVSISFTDSDNNQQRETEQVGIRPHERTRFEVVSVDHDVPQAGEGTMTVEISHTAGKPIEDVSVTASTTESEVYLGSEGSRSATSMVGAWGPNEKRRITFRVGTTENALDRSYPIDLEFEYTDADDNENSRTAFVEFRPKERDAFAISSVDHDVPQNGEGTMTITADLLEGKDVSDVTVTVRTTESELYLGSEGSRSATAVIEEWAAGETEALTFRAGTTENAVDRPYPIEVTFEYTDAADNQNTHTESIEIRPKARERFDVRVVDHDVPQDGEGTMTVEVTHTGKKSIEDVSVTASTTASEVYLGSEGSRSAESLVGDWAAGETRRLTYRVGTTENAVNRSYPVELEFEYTDADDNENARSAFVEFRPEKRDAFEIQSVDHDVPRNGEGTLTITADLLEGKDVSDVTVTVRTTESEVYIGSEGSRSGEAVIGDWSAGDEQSLTFRVGTTENAVDRSYPIEVVFAYTDAADNQNTHTEYVEVRPVDRERFDVQLVEHDVPQNGEGTMTLAIENTVDTNVSDVSVTLSAGSSEVYIGSESSRSESSIVERWGAGERNEFTFRVGTTDDAVDRAYPISVQLEYTDDADNENAQTEPLEFYPGGRDRFRIESVDHDVPQNGEGTMAIEVTHTGSKPIADVAVVASTRASDVYLGAEASQSSRAVVGTWDPGETRQLTFRAGTNDDAVDRSYPIDLHFQYTDAADNDNERSKTVDFEPTHRKRFRVSLEDHGVPRNGEGTLTIELDRVGRKDLSDVSVTASTPESEVYLGSESSRSATALIGDWNTADEKELTFRVGTSDDAVERPYPIELTLEYTDENDNDNERTKYVEFEPRGGDRFEVETVDHDVPQNGEGTVTVALQYTGDEEISDVAVTGSTSETDVYLGAEGSRSSETLVDEWDPGETRRLTFRAGTTANALDRAYPLELALEYTDDANNDNRETEHVEFVPRNRDHFRVSSLEHDVPTSGEGTVLVEVEHTGSEPIEDVTVTASTAESELYLGSTGSRSAAAMVGTWAPGETRRLTFRVGTEDVVSRTYPLELEFEYTDTANNDNRETRYVEFVPADEDFFTVRSVEHDVPRNGVGTVTVTVSHEADKSFSDVAVTASTSESEVYLGSESSRSATAIVNEWAGNQTHRLTFRVGTTENAVRRSYPLELRFDYTDDADNDNQDVEYVAFEPQAQPDFAVESVDSNVPIAGTGIVELTLKNEGPTNATEATLSISSPVNAVFFGSGSSSEPIEAGGFVVERPRTATPASQAYIGDWPVGETRTVYFRAGFESNAMVREYPAELTISYENGAGHDMPDQSRSVGIRPRPNQTFSFDLVESNLYVGEEGTLVGRITNVGNRTAEGLVVTVENQRQNVNFYTNRYAIGTLDPGESATFDYRVGVTEETEPGPRLFELSARYRDPQGNVRHTDTQDLAVEIGPGRDAFGVETEDVTFSPGGSGELVLTVTNRRNETLTDVQAKLFTDDPLDSSDDSAFIPELEPGESKRITLEVSVAGSAGEKTYSASMDFRFDDARGDSELSDTYRVPVTVERSEGGSDLPTFLGIVATFSAVAIVGWRFEALDRGRQWIRERL